MLISGSGKKGRLWHPGLYNFQQPGNRKPPVAFAQQPEREGELVSRSSTLSTEAKRAGDVGRHGGNLSPVMQDEWLQPGDGMSVSMWVATHE